MIKIAFFDVDGTLLRLGHKELSANTAAALRQLHQNGIILCMATGRSYTGVPHFMELILMSCSPLTAHSSPQAMISSSKILLMSTTNIR